MKKPNLISSLVATLALGGMVLAPMAAFADDGHKGHDKHWNNGKSPKKNGRHDNRRQWDDDHGSRSRVYRDRYGNVLRDDRHRDSTSNRSYNNNDYRYRSSGATQRELDHRQQTKNQWRNLAYLGGAVAAWGLLKHEPTLVFAGTAGALYSLTRYEHDRKSQNRLERSRAYYFGQPSFVRDGRRYERRLVTRNGVRYYQFVRR